MNSFLKTLFKLFSFIDKAGPRKTLRLVAFILIIVPTIYFSSVTYVSDSSQLAVNRVRYLFR